MNMPLGATRPPEAAVTDGARAGGSGAPGSGGGTGGEADADSGTDGRVDGTTQEPYGRYLDAGGDRRGTDDDPTGAAEWDLLTDAAHWSPEAYLLLGCDPEHGPLSLDRLPDRLPEADRPLLRRMMTDALVHGRSAAGTLRVHRPDGRYQGVECAGEPVLGTDGTVTALRMRFRATPSA
ncbi:PAS domain-containing protein [Kitasatospora brasiliensis]|uniref:PAS domain-containing protein n=1 Tax=Kitasatospora brasiliensis TaxID=3058040 RepID=UPI00292CD489|nr:PAS domain-containing protein [Kitasatospora sp. K002]